MKNTVEATLFQSSGPIYIERAEYRIALYSGDGIYESDTIITGKDTTADIVFRDGTKSRLAPNTELKIVDFEFGPGDDAPSFIMNLTQGTMRTITGELVKLNPDSYKIITPRATVEVNGTEFINSIAGTQEIHAVLFISAGSEMIVEGADHQAVVLTTPLQVVTVAENGTVTTPRQLLMSNMEETIGLIAPTLAGNIPTSKEGQGNWEQNPFMPAETLMAENDTQDEQDEQEQDEQEQDEQEQDEQEQDEQAEQQDTLEQNEQVEKIEIARVEQDQKTITYLKEKTVTESLPQTESDVADTLLTLGLILSANLITDVNATASGFNSITSNTESSNENTNTGTQQPDIPEITPDPTPDITPDLKPDPTPDPTPTPLPTVPFEGDFTSESLLLLVASAEARDISIAGNVEIGFSGNAETIGESLSNPKYRAMPMMSAMSAETTTTTTTTIQKPLITTWTGGDTITIKGDVGREDNNKINVSGDATTVNMSSGSTLTLGDDKINVEGILFKSYITGDARYVNYQEDASLTFGDDTITLNILEGNSSIYGDARNISGTGEFKHLSYGDDIITVTTMTGGNIYGDAFSGGYNGQVNDQNESVESSIPFPQPTATDSGKDVITVVTANSASKENNIQISAGYGDDFIDIGSATATDSGTILIRGEAGIDTIKVGTIIISNNGAMNIHGGFGDDNITVNNLLSRAAIYGDTNRLPTEETLNFDNDTIIVTTDITGGTIIGDTFSISNKESLETIIFGEDDITINGDMTGGNIAGDAITIKENSELSRLTFGNDEITVINMADGAIFGDAHTVSDNSNLYDITYGNDTIEVTTMTGGSIYSDVANDPSIAAVTGSGEDIIDIGSITNSGTDNIIISSGYGVDTIDIDAIINKSTGTVRIYGGAGDDIITIDTFKNINNGEIEIYGGAGNDTTNINNAGDSSGFITFVDFGTTDGSGKDIINIKGFDATKDYSAEFLSDEEKLLYVTFTDENLALYFKNTANDWSGTATEAYKALITAEQITYVT